MRVKETFQRHQTIISFGPQSLAHSTTPRLFSDHQNIYEPSHPGQDISQLNWESTGLLGIVPHFKVNHESVSRRLCLLALGHPCPVVRKQRRKGGRERGTKGRRKEEKEGGGRGKGVRKKEEKQKIGRPYDQRWAYNLQAIMPSVLAGLLHEAVPAEVTPLLTVASRNPRNTLTASLVIL